MRNPRLDRIPWSVLVVIVLVWAVAVAVFFNPTGAGVGRTAGGIFIVGVVVLVAIWSAVNYLLRPKS